MSNYDELFKRLSRHLGSPEFARDAIQDTYLRVEHVADTPPIRSPLAYLYSIAINLAKDRRRADTRRMSDAEIDSLLDIADDSPDPARIVEARNEFNELKRAISELPPRCQEIFLAVKINECSIPEIAKYHGISTRTVEMELRRAIAHCTLRLDRIYTRRFGPKGAESSRD